MLILAADTSGKHGSIALVRGNSDGSCEVIELVPLTGGTFSAQLVPQIAALLDKHGFRKEDIGAFAVASGPGSFTGLRVGLAAIKALAEVLQRPIAVVSLLEAIATAGGTRGQVLAALDAGRNEIYAGEYEVEASGAQLIRERLVTREELVESASNREILTPDRSVVEVACEQGGQVREVERPRSDAIGRLGWQKILSGDTVSPDALEANYIRRSDAEIFAKSS
ncbi:MAG TPA: tRNA (adenosine(37)-N6)-threonylcarbamoyltransferase complex dimerization subunit type 1 TsaB [Terriglobales bacterium]|jgi:tRNA threonylcarbamoyladenosine biosynthesis protein TsaB|nr:tRNA (adenosine(37)-N6)-threonylcarbamoyltransferase complex dimerization subunit type 1 TsaB [Terriglobales bacterium]